MNRIERWTRRLLEAEARKRGIRNAELRSRVELLRAIVHHDYGARQNLRGARKLIGGLLDGAAQALPLLSARRGTARSCVPIHTAQTGQSVHVHGAAAAHTSHGTQNAHVTTSLPAPATEPSAPTQAGAPSSLRLRRDSGQLELVWQVSAIDAQRARNLLGHPGELSLRVVCVQADPAQIVRSEVTEHGPLDPSGTWTLILPGPESQCVGAVGVRHGDRFVSIAHQSSRVP